MDGSGTRRKHWHLRHAALVALWHAARARLQQQQPVAITSSRLRPLPCWWLSKLRGHRCSHRQRHRGGATNARTNAKCAPPPELTGPLAAPAGSSQHTQLVAERTAIARPPRRREKFLAPRACTGRPSHYDSEVGVRKHRQPQTLQQSSKSPMAVRWRDSNSLQLPHRTAIAIPFSAKSLTSLGMENINIYAPFGNPSATENINIYIYYSHLSVQ
eukprot:COSAG02_NODE_92_length_37588_cov_135.916242_39_plen_215_part_00